MTCAVIRDRKEGAVHDHLKRLRRKTDLPTGNAAHNPTHQPHTDCLRSSLVHLDVCLLDSGSEFRAVQWHDRRERSVSFERPLQTDLSQGRANVKSGLDLKARQTDQPEPPLKQFL